MSSHVSDPEIDVEGLSDGVLSLRDEDGQLYDVTVTLIREVGRG